MDVEDSQRSDFTDGLHRSTGSFELVLAPVLLALGGLWLDRTIGTTPLFVVILAVAGFAGAALSLYYRYIATMAEHESSGRWVRRG